MPLTDKQREYLKSCNHRWNIKTGATGSGKTYLDIAATIPLRVQSCRGDGLIVLLGNTKGTLDRNVLEPMRQLWPGLVSGISSNNTVMIFGKKCYALGADNKKHVDRIRGATFEYVYGDEVATWSEDVFEIVKSRLRCPNSHFDGTCNPEAPTHWFKKFLDRDDLDVYQQRYVIDDGKLPADVVANLKKEYTGTVYYDRYILGLWAAADGAVYRPFADNPSRFIVKEPPATVYHAIGIDFGGGTSAHAFCCVGFTRGYDKLVVLDEWYCKDALTPAKLEEAFVDFASACQQKYGVGDVWCDSAEQTLIKGLRTAAARARLAVNVGNAMKRPINDRIRAATRMMASDRFLILDRCTHTIEALRTAVWDSRVIDKDARLDNGTSNIDSLDAMEYAYERSINSMLSDYRR